MLRVRDLQVSHGKVPALHGVGLDVAAGQIVALVGGNGNGKSTTLRAIAGIDAIDEGSIVLDGEHSERLPAHLRVSRGLSLVPEGRRLFPRLTVERNLELGAFARKDAAGIAGSLDRVYDIFPILRERRRQAAGTLSGGEQQMVAIARGLMAGPRLLMLDEPSWGIAPILVGRIFETIQAINRTGVSILLVEQNVQRALALAHRAYVIQTGRIVLAGEGRELLGSDLVRRAYLGM